MNESLNYYMENVVIDRQDLYINLDKFESGKSNVILITGFSGSGKTTLAKELARKYKCKDYIELDSLEWYLDHKITEDNLKEGIPVCYEFLNQHPKYKNTNEKPKGEAFTEMYRSFISFVINWCKRRKPDRYVIEGLQLYESVKKGETPSYISEPMVLRGVSGLKSIYRAMKRNGASLNELPEYLHWYITTNHQLEALYKAMKKEYENEKEITESSNDIITNFLSKYGESPIVYEESIDNPIYNHKNEEVPKKCNCGGNIREFLMGKPVYLCENCMKFYGFPQVTDGDSTSICEDTFDEIGHEFDVFFEEALKDTTILRDHLYPKVESCLSNPSNVKKLKKIISDFVEKNTDKLTTPGPQYLIIFGDQDKDLYYKLFDITKAEVVSSMKDVVKQTGSKSDFKYLLGNPFLAFLYYIIRYFTYHKDEKALNACLSMFAIDVYWSIFTKYFPNGVLEPFMNYTIDNLTDKFIIKKAGTIFGALTESARRSYGFHETKIRSGNDAECVSFMQRIRNDQNSMFRTLSQIYYKNYKEGNAIATRNENYDPNNPIIDDVRTSSTDIQAVVDKTCMPMISNGIDVVLAEAAARMSNISITNLRVYLTKIFVNERLSEITQLVESMIFLFINEDRRSIREIKSRYFLYWSSALFKKTNSKDGNIIRINTILDKWGTETGIYEAFKSEGSRINYRKAIFLYIAMSVQKYN